MHVKLNMINPTISSSTLTSILVFAILLIGCGPSDTKDESGLRKDEREQVVQDILKTIDDLPVPSVVPNTIQEIGAEFNHSLISELHGMDEYVQDVDKAALNLGIYATDISYLVAYEQIEESVDHMVACQRLSEALGVATIYDDSTMHMYETLADNHEELMAHLDRTLVAAEKRLTSSDQLSMAALVLTGSAVEGLYLSMKVIREFHTDDMDPQTREALLEPLVQLVLSQKDTLLDIIAMLKDIPTDEEIATVIAELSILERLFEGDLKDVEEGMAADENFHVTPDMLLDVGNEILRIRGEMVSIE